MKTLYLFISLSFLYCSASWGQQVNPVKEPIMPPGTINHFYAPTTSYKVTIESANGLVSVVSIPIGVFLNVQFYELENPEYHEWDGGPRTFRGDIVIRARRSDEIKPEVGGGAQEMMNNSPFEISLSDAVVLVEKIR